jgi:hypothetical protein
MFSGEDVPPQETSQGRAESCAEGAVVDTECHAVHCPPERPIADGNPVVFVDLLPCLDYSGEEDGGADVCAGELVTGLVITCDTVQMEILTLHRMTERKPIPPILPTVPV